MKQMTLKQRAEALRNLIKDAVELGFDEDLVKEYQKQENEVNSELDQEAQEKKDFRDIS